MKKTIALLTMVAAGVALAGAVESTDTFGVLKVTSPNYETILSVPWVEAGSSGSELISVTNFVKTANLTVGDALLLYDPNSGAYQGWALASAASGKYWNAVNVSYNGANRPAGSFGATLTRGQALILVRKSVEDQDIYLYGQYKNPSDVSHSIVCVAGKTTLFAPVNTSSSGLDLNKLTFTGAETGDKIRLQGKGTVPVTFSYNGSKWGRTKSTGWTDADIEISAGEGVWYIPKSTKTVTVSGI